MHESPRTPCRYQLYVHIYACTTSTAFTLAPCWHQIRMHHINSLHFCAFASAFNNCKPTTAEGCLSSHSKGSLFFFSLFHDADRRATKRLLHRVQHDAVEWRKRTSTSVYIGQLRRPACKGRRNDRGDRGPAPRRSAADAAPKKNGDQAKRARMARRSNQNSIPSSPSSPSIRSKSDGAGPGVRSTVLYGAFGRSRSRVSLEWFVRVVLFELLFQCSR